MLLLDGQYYPMNKNFLTGQGKPGVTHKAKDKKNLYLKLAIQKSH